MVHMCKHALDAALHKRRSRASSTQRKHRSTLRHCSAARLCAKAFGRGRDFGRGAVGLRRPAT